MSTPTGFFPAPKRRCYFFDAGIHFECRRCGACCIGAPGTVYITAREIARLASHLRLSTEELRQRYLYPYKDSFSIREHADGRCIFFDQGCMIYTLRPNQCRTFPFWLSNLRSEHSWRQIAAQCPGIGRGRLYRRDEILKILHMALDF